MKAHLDLLEWMLRKWNVQEESFVIGDHRLTIDANDIYLLSGFPHCGVDISLYGHRQGGGTISTYLVQHCFQGDALKNGGIDMKIIERLHLIAINFTIA